MAKWSKMWPYSGLGADLAAAHADRAAPGAPFIAQLIDVEVVDVLLDDVVAARAR